MSNPFDRQMPIPGIKNVIVVGSGKGGVGKSTVTANLAVALKSLGRRVGLLDADVYGPSIPRMLGATNEPPQVDESSGKIQPILRHGVRLMSMGFLLAENDAVVWRGPMLFKAIEQFFGDVAWGELDDLIIDLPPGTGDIALTIAQKVPVSGAVVVCTPQNIALADAKKAVDMFVRLGVPVFGVVENMSAFHPPGGGEPVKLFPVGDLRSFLEAKKLELLAEMPFDPQIGLSSEAGLPIVVSESTHKVSEEFANLARKVAEKADAQWS